MALANRLFQSYLEEEGEDVHYIIHRHIFTMVKPIAQVIGLHIIIPLTLFLFLNIQVPLFKLFCLGWIILGISKIIFTIMSWYFNALLITNLNIIHIDWEGFFTRQAFRIEYSQIDEFSYAFIGFFNTIFNYGTLTISKSSGSEVSIVGVFRPKKKTELLTQIQEHIVDQQLKKDHEGLKEVLTTLLRDHIAEHGIAIVDD